MAMLMTLSQRIQAIDVDVQSALGFAQLLAHARLLGGEALQFRFLFGRQHERGLVVALALQLGQLGFGLLQFGLQLQRLAAQAVVGLAPAAPRRARTAARTWRGRAR